MKSCSSLSRAWIPSGLIVSAAIIAFAMFSCIYRRKPSLSVSIRLKALTVTSCNRSSLTIRLVQFMTVRLGSRRLMHRQTILFTFAAVVIPVDSPVDSLDDLCLFRVDDEVPVAVLGISEKVIVIDLYLSLLVAVL